MSKAPALVVSDCNGRIFDIPELQMAGMTADTPCRPGAAELIPLPNGSDLCMLPLRKPVGYDPASKSFVAIDEYHGVPVYATAAFMAPAYLQVMRSAYQTLPGAPRLSLYSYTAVGWSGGRFVVPAVRTDPDQRQDLENFDLAVIRRRARAIQKKYPRNRLVNHLVENCVLRYGCPAARNFAMGRWECPIPTARTCNASCLGCLSLQPKSSGVTASHGRLCFTPTPEEIAQFTVPHLEHAPRPVVSFGQGCEGEPLVNAELLVAAVKLIRSRTAAGIINLNTNASRPDAVEALCKVGLDSMRVSMNSAQESYYNAYYRPRGYALDDVEESLKIVRCYKRWSSLNYLVFPGLTDTKADMAALDKLVRGVKLNMIQTRNLNIDPEWYIESLGLDKSRQQPAGIPAWVAHYKKKFPNLKLGYFNPPHEEMLKCRAQGLPARNPRSG